MNAPRNIAVIDIGKTNAKVAVFDLATLKELARLDTTNTVIQTGLYPHYDIETLWQFILGSLAALGANHKIDAVSITTHGACAAFLDAQGNLALPVLDYEYGGPQNLAAEYDVQCAPFEQSGSPRLPNGLNLGAQIYWLEKTFVNEFAWVHWIVSYPQYWAFRLSGVLANEVTSLGCHTDLWNYQTRDYSSLVERMGWRKLMPELRQASDCLGTLLPEIATLTGLRNTIPVYCGIHDSNASLLPHLRAREKPFAVVSTGTWVICMAIGGRPIALDQSRDTLVNVNAFGEPVPSARFMGGREFEILGTTSSNNVHADDINFVLLRKAALLPSVVNGCGPFPNRSMTWLNANGLSAPQKHIVVSWYLALMTATCLNLVGAEGPVIVEGPFTQNNSYLEMLAAATQRPVHPNHAKGTGTTQGAALLCNSNFQPLKNDFKVEAVRADFQNYAANWMHQVNAEV